MSLSSWWRTFVTFIYNCRVITLDEFKAIPGIIVKPVGYKQRHIGYSSGPFMYNHNRDLLSKPIYRVENVFHGQMIYHLENGQKQRLLLNLSKPTHQLATNELQRSFTLGGQYMLHCCLGMFFWLSNDVSRWCVTRH